MALLCRPETKTTKIIHTEMKKTLLTFSAIAAILVSVFSSCKKNGENEPEIPIENEIAGTYKGTAEIKMDENTLFKGIPLLITLEKDGNNTITVKTGTLLTEAFELPSFDFEGCSVLAYDGAYMFSGEKDITIDIPEAGTLSVSVSGLVSEGEMEADFSVNGQKTTLHFDGKRLTGNETSEARITEFKFENSQITNDIAKIDDAAGTITFRVGDNATDEDLKALAPTITVSEKATVIPASGVAQDFSGGKKVKYTVFAENGETKIYNAYIEGSLSAACDITGFSFESNDNVISVEIDNENSKIYLNVKEGADLTALTPEITVSEKATVTPASGVAQDFSEGKRVEYTVTAESGASKVYTAMVKGAYASVKFSFEEWRNERLEMNGVADNDLLLPEDIWGSSATGAQLICLYGIDVTLQKKTEDKTDGTYAASLTTLDASSIANSLVPAITSGSIFIGKFELDMGNRLKSTKFGVDPKTLGIDGKPLYFKGNYKYKPGEIFKDGSAATKPDEVVIVEGKKDECSIVAVLYEAKDENGNEVTLTGVDINNSPYRVAVAQLADGTEKAEYTEFNIPFEYLKDYDASKEYKFTIVCASSKEGDLFKGAGGSNLIIDEFEIISE